MDRIRTGKCVDCGREITRRLRSDRAFVCEECGEDRLIAAIVEQQQRSGTNYERWKAGMRKAMQRIDTEK